MGCAASVPAVAGPDGQTGPIYVQPSAGTTSLPRTQAQTAPRQAAPQQGQDSGSLATVPVVRSLVALHKDSCSLETDAKGHFYLHFGFSSLSAGVASASFLVTGGGEVTQSKGLQAPKAARSSSQMEFETGSGQQGRLLLCEVDLAESLLSFAEEEKGGGYHVMLDLQASQEDPKAVTAQRSFLKLPAEGKGEVHVQRQLVQCGSLVRAFDPLYGSVPKPGGSPPAASFDEGDCVICLSNPREVAILHCRHVCLCRSCAQITSSTWSFQCPVCRGRVAAMVGLKSDI